VNLEDYWRVTVTDTFEANGAVGLDDVLVSDAEIGEVLRRTRLHDDPYLVGELAGQPLAESGPGSLDTLLVKAER